MVARVFEPGCIMRSVPVLEGAQERGKSTGLRVLAGDRYFADTAIDLGSKDAYEQIQGVWLYEISEMHSFNRAEATRVKQFISSPEDTWVPKYVRGRVKVKRQVVFAGSTNESLYLKDWTGNTRFWPLRCESNGERINLARIAGQREQLFAEAVARYKAGDRRYPTAEEATALFEPEQAARLIEHPWMEVIRGWLAGTTVANVTTVEVLHEACKVETSKMTMLQMQDVGRLMSLLGWERKRKSTGDRGWVYVRPQQVSESRQNDEEKPF
jgi:predicted P-loop ATPase